MKQLFLTAAMVFIYAATAFANEDEIIWVKAEAYPTGAGTVYTDWSPTDDKAFDATSEFKRYANMAISTAYIWTQPAGEWLFSGIARDNGNQIYDNGTDLQVKVNPDGLFTAIPYPEVFKGSSSTTEADELAQEALENLEKPTDYLFAVFSKGAVSRVAEDQIGCGYAYADKLYTEPGDQVTFSAYGDYFSLEGGGVKYFRFDHWTDEQGSTVGTERELTVTVSGPAIYYAHFAETTKEEFKATENDPHISEHYYDGGLGGSTGINDMNREITNNRYYDIQGRSVENPTKGLYVRNGKKFIVR